MIMTYYAQKLDRDSFEIVRISSYKSAAKGKKPISKRVRKILAKTMIHRAWLQGRTGSFLLSVQERI